MQWFAACVSPDRPEQVAARSHGQIRFSRGSVHCIDPERSLLSSSCMIRTPGNRRCGIRGYRATTGAITTSTLMLSILQISRGSCYRSEEALTHAHVESLASNLREARSQLGSRCAFGVETAVSGNPRRIVELADWVICYGYGSTQYAQEAIW